MFLGQPLGSLVISSFGHLVREAGQRSNREDIRNCDSKLREKPLISAALGLSAALLTLVSLTHSCSVVTKHGEASGPSFSPPLWPTVSLTGLISPTTSMPRKMCRPKAPTNIQKLKCIHGNVGTGERNRFYERLVHHHDACRGEPAFPNELRIKFPTMSCWLFMAWFHIHLSTPSQQMGLRIYAFLQQWCFQSGKLPLDGRRDNKRGIRLDQYHSAHLCSANSIKV